MAPQKDDLIPEGFPRDLKWTLNDAVESLGRLFDFVDKECATSMNWYFEKKKKKRIAAYICRWGAIFLVAAAAAVPIVSQMPQGQDATGLSPAWATILVIFAGVLISLDHFGGYTSGWVRYVNAAQLLGDLQADNQMEWELQRQAMQNGATDVESVKKGILMCKDFLGKVHDIVRNETNQWAQEFQKALAELEKGKG